MSIVTQRRRAVRSETPARNTWGLSLLLLFLTSMAQAHTFGDDYGDAPTNAASLTLNSNRSGRIEIDIDRDWFSFTASPLKQYTAMVKTGTLWDSTFVVVGPDATTVLASTDSVLIATSRVSWVHFGPSGKYYVGVGGFAEFTTGTYSIVVMESAYTDLDHDGMEDGWEKAYFGRNSLAASDDFDGDGVSNLKEFLAGSNPADPKSKLLITGMIPDTNRVSVSWQAASRRFYRLCVSTNLMTQAWQPLGLVTNLQPSTVNMQISDTNADAGGVRYYRVQCVIE